MPRPPLTSRSPLRYTRDAFDRLTGRRNGLVPPTRLMYDGPQSVAAFEENGEEFFRLFRELGGLGPDDRVLDVGSGMGRKTLPLLGYLSDRGSYDGLEIVRTGVDWCNRKIASRRPNFNFTWADVYNGLYNPEGAIQPAEYRFPYDDASFDFVVLGSVFTHMLPGDMAHYLDEIARVSAAGARAMISFFIVDAEAQRLMAADRSSIAFEPRDGYYAGDPAYAEGATAYDERAVRDLYEKAGLRLAEPIWWGSWSGREDHTSYQDLVVSEAPAAARRRAR